MTRARVVTLEHSFGTQPERGVDLIARYYSSVDTLLFGF